MPNDENVTSNILRDEDTPSGGEITPPDTTDSGDTQNQMWFTLQLKTRAPVAKMVIGNGSGYIGTRDVNVFIETEDTDIAGYKLWGDIAGEQPAGGTATEDPGDWVTLDAPSQFPVIPVRFFDGEVLTKGDDGYSKEDAEAYEGIKTLHLKLIDELGNESGEITASVMMDLSVPEPVIFNGPIPRKISKVDGKNIARFSFMVNEDINEYVVCVVPDKSATVDQGVRIEMEYNSVNMHGSKPQNGVIAATDTVIDCEITGADLQAASPLDGFKTIKVFVKNLSGLWSV